MNDIGLIGLGVMGRNLALNIEGRGYSVSVFNQTSKKIEDFTENEAKGRNILGCYDIESFVNSLQIPRKIFLMTKTGEPVDSMINILTPYLDHGDLIMDGGNTYFPDTSRRIEELKEKGILFLGIGVSGGESGALLGPSIMVGGTREAYDLVEELLLKISAQTEDGYCCSYVGDGAAGHFVKMIHNGIEYGMMQVLSEVYHVMRKVLKLSAEEIADVFEQWNKGDLNSYLMEISTLSFFPLAYLLLNGVLKTIDPSMEEASQNLGGTRWNTFYKVTFPLTKPAIANSFLLVFIKSIAKYLI